MYTQSTGTIRGRGCANPWTTFSVLALFVAGVVACSDDAAPTLPPAARPLFGKNVTGSNQRILFNSSRDGDPWGEEIYSMNPDGSGVTRLTVSAGPDVASAWSPDGKRVAFTSWRSGALADIYVMNWDGTEVQRLTFGPGYSVVPSWSKDGRQIVFTSNRSAADPQSGTNDDDEIYVMNADGTGVTRLTTNNVEEGATAWSSDGRTIAFVSKRDHPSDIASDLYLMNADGSNVTRLTFQDELVGRPSWDPHSRRIAYSAESGIYVINADGSGLTRLTFGYVGRDQFPTWSADGSKLAFMSNRDGNNEIYVMNADGTGQTRLTVNETTDAFPRWSR